MEREGRGSSSGSFAHGRMTVRLLPGPRKLALAVGAALLLLLALPGISFATVSVSRADLSGDRLRIEGIAAANRTITVDGVAMGSSDGGGRFRIERTGFTPPPDCTVDVNDGSATATTAELEGCTLATEPDPASPSLSGLSLNQTSVVGGNPVTGTVTLNVAAPADGVVVSLSSNNTSVATVPSSVTVAEGLTIATFTVTTSMVTNSESATIIGTAGGETRSSTLTVTSESSAESGSISLARGAPAKAGSRLSPLESTAPSLLTAPAGPATTCFSLRIRR